jgi:hypothetical protein
MLEGPRRLPPKAVPRRGGPTFFFLVESAGLLTQAAGGLSPDGRCPRQAAGGSVGCLHP